MSSAAVPLTNPRKSIRYFFLTASRAAPRHRPPNQFRTLKQQIVDRRVFQTIDEARQAKHKQSARRGAEWLIDKNGFRSTLAVRAAPLDTKLKQAAPVPRNATELF
jgi:hypothetical protein